MIIYLFIYILFTQVFSFDARKLDQPLFTMQAHTKACSSVSYSALARDLVVTSGLDKTVKLWDIGGNVPTNVGSKTMAIGACYLIRFETVEYGWDMLNLFEWR